MPRNIRPIRVEGNIAFVPLTRGYEAVIGADDAHLVSGHNWYSIVERRKDGSIRAVYAGRSAWLGGGKRKDIQMHRVIAGIADGMETDHIDTDGLNNRRSNLRPASNAQNQHNERRRANNTSGFKGVHWHKRDKKWEASIRVHGKRYSKTFATAESAADWYADASFKLHGQFGRIG